MPYEGEYASKASHSDFLRNPDIRSFLGECEYLKPPSEEEVQSLADRFTEPPLFTGESPTFVMAIDGSNYESNIDNKLPNTRVGYIKIGAMLINMEKFNTLKDGRFVDPFRVAEMRDDNAALTFSVPSANIKWGGKDNVRDSFRAYVDSQLSGPRTRFEDSDPSTSLRSTLFYLASLGKLGTGDSTKLRLHSCPKCEAKGIELRNTNDQQYCSECNEEVYITDCLRIWEYVNDFQSNQWAITLLMQAIEHLVMIHYIKYLFKTPLLLSNMVFFVDGPLANFGPTAWLHTPVMQFLGIVNKKLEKFNQPPLSIIGLQKTGQIVDHVAFIDKYLPNNRLFAIDDEYRYKYIVTGRERTTSSDFGHETHYGQDFIYKTPNDRAFVFAIPFPYSKKSDVGRNFSTEKIRFENYEQLPRVLDIITRLESDLYENAVVPIALAHKYTAISLQPGGHVLDLLTRNALNP